MLATNPSCNHQELIYAIGHVEIDASAPSEIVDRRLAACSRTASKTTAAMRRLRAG
jgi:hypothetical protein